MFILAGTMDLDIHPDGCEMRKFSADPEVTLTCFCISLTAQDYIPRGIKDLEVLGTALDECPDTTNAQDGYPLRS